MPESSINFFEIDFYFTPIFILWNFVHENFSKFFVNINIR